MIETSQRDLNAERVQAEAVTRAQARARSFIQTHPGHDLQAVTGSFVRAALHAPAAYIATTNGTPEGVWAALTEQAV